MQWHKRWIQVDSNHQPPNPHATWGFGRSAFLSLWIHIRNTFHSAHNDTAGPEGGITRQETRTHYFLPFLKKNSNNPRAFPNLQNQTSRPRDTWKINTQRVKLIGCVEYLTPAPKNATSTTKPPHVTRKCKKRSTNWQLELYKRLQTVLFHNTTYRQVALRPYPWETMNSNSSFFFFPLY